MASKKSDSDISNSKGDGHNYPVMRSFSFGISITLLNCLRAMKRSTYIWSLLVGCVAFATSCDLTEDVQVKADKSMIFGSKSGLELYSNSFYKALPTLKNGFMQDKMCDVGAVSNTDTFIKQGAYNTETATSWS